MTEGSSVSKEDMANFHKRHRMLFAPKIPLCSDRYVPEIKRLAGRKIPTGRDIDEDACEICYSKDHWSEDCSYTEDIPSDIKDLDPKYDRVCRGCGTIGMECCPEGSYAVRKSCSFCNKSDHWFWEERCPEDYFSKMSCYRLWKCFKDGKPIQNHPLQIPFYKQKKGFGEVLRLMQRQQTRSPPQPVGEGCCTLCYVKGHPYYECPYVESIPEDAVIGPDFDEVCAGCGRIGVRCCGRGAYPIEKSCKFCHSPGHWYWEDKHVYDYTREYHDRKLVDKFKNFVHKVLKKSLQMEMVKLTT